MRNLDRFSALLEEFGPLSAQERRLLTLGIRGGDGDEATPVADLLAQAAGLTDLEDGDLAALEEQLLAAAEQLLEAPTDESLEQAQQVAAAVSSLRAAAAERIAHAEENLTRAEQIRAELAGDPEGGDGETPAGEGETPPAGEGEGETPAGEGEQPAAGGEGDPAPAGEAAPAAEPAAPIAAAASSPARAVARRPAAMRTPAAPAAPEFRLVASANAPGVPAGQILDTPERIMGVFEHALRASQGYRGPRLEMPLMQLGAFDPAEIYGEQRTLRRDARINAQRIDAVTSPEALRASGGICAPVPVQYDLPIWGTDARPVRDAFARFGADRGGVRLLTPPTLSDVSGAVSVWTEANDVDPGSDGPETKPCLVLDCPDETETLVAAIVHCLTIGNFRARFFPEQVQAWVNLVGVQQAKVADTRLIQKLGDESTQITVTEILGSTRTILAAIERAAASMRNFHRIDPTFPFRFMAPAWLRNNMIVDLIREAPGSTDERLATSEATIDGFLRARHINPTWFLDGEAGQIFTQQLDGNLLGWPDEVVTYLYPEGSWLHLDAGTLDFGIVRDSTLNSVNDFQMMAEDFEESAFHGVPGTSYRMLIDICPNGQAAALDDTSGLCTSGS